MKIEISEATFRRLQNHAEPLVDTVEDVIVTLLEHFESTQENSIVLETIGGEQMSDRKLRRLSGFRKELWELVIQRLPVVFSLHDVYKHQEPLVQKRPHVREMEASIRAGLQRLRDMGYLEFLERGEYRRVSR